MGFNWDSSQTERPSFQASMPSPNGAPVLTEADARLLVGRVPPEQPDPNHLVELDWELKNARDPKIRAELLAEREKVSAGLKAGPPAAKKSGFSWDSGTTSEVPLMEPPKRSGFDTAKRELEGLGVGLADLVGSIPGAILGVGRGAVDVAANAAGRLVGQEWGNKPSVALEGTMGAMESTMPSKLIGKVPGLGEIPEDLKKTYGYRAGMAPMDGISYVLQLIGSGYGEIVKALGGTEQAAKEVDSVTQLGLMLLTLGRGKGRSVAPTDVQYARQYESQSGQKQTIKEQDQKYQDLTKGRMSNQTANQAAEIRGARLSDDAKAPAAWDRPDLGQQQAFPFQQDYVGGRQGGILNPEIIARLEAELNPPIERRVPNQMELFSNEKKDQFGELLNGSRVTTEGGVIPRTRPEPEFGTRPPDPRNLPYEQPAYPIEQFGPAKTLPEALPWTGPGRGQRGAIGEPPNIGRPNTYENAPADWKKSALLSERQRLDDGIKRNTQVLEELQSGKLSNSLTEYLLSQNKMSPIQLLKETQEVLRDLQKDIAKNEVDMVAVEKTLSQPKAPVSSFRGPGRSQGGWIGSFDRTAAKKGLTSAILDARKVHREEKRPLAEVGKEMLEQKTPDLKAKNLANFGVPKQVSYLAHNPIIKWAADNLLRIDRETHSRIQSIIEGDNFKTDAKGRERRVLDETIGLGLFHKYAKDKNRAIRAEMSEMKDMHLENIGKAPLTRESFRTERQWTTYQAIQEGYRKTLDDFNKARVAAGNEPTQPITNYSPFILEGDYRVWAKDTEGKTVGIGGVNYSWQAKNMVKLFKQKFPDAVVKWGPSQKTRYDLGDLSGFHEAMKIMETEGNPKLAKEFSKIYADIMSHRGAGKRALHKTGVAGPMNFLIGDKGLIAYEHAFTSYVNSVYRYIGNVEKSKLKSELIELDKPVKEAQKNAIDYSNQIIDAAKGKNLKEDWVGDAIGALTEKPLGLLGSDFGVGRNFSHRYISGMSALVLPYLLATGRMVISQLVQPGANLAKLSKLKEIGDVQGNPALRLMEGYQQMLSPDRSAVEAMNWAAREGYTSPTIISYFDRTIGNLPTHQAKKVMHGLKIGFAAMEQHMVRIPSFLAYEKALREKIPNKQERFEYAAKVMDDTVVNYSEVNMPLIYNKMGIIGEAGKGLKQYAHNVWGQFLDYVAFAKDTGKVAPLGWFLGNTLTVAGLKGMPLVAEAAAFIALYNLIAEESIPSPEKKMWELSDQFADDYPDSVLGNKKLHQALIQGGLSTALRYDVSSSVSHPGLPQMFSFPALAMTERMFKDSLEFIYKYFKGQATDMDSMKAALSLFPNAGTGFIEELYTEEGGMTPNPNRNMEGVYERDETDKWVAKMLSLRHVDEVKKRAIVQGARMLIKQDMAQKLSAVDAITDRVANGKEITPDLMKQFMEEGGNPSTLRRTIQKRLEERLMDPVEQISRGKMTPEKYNKLMRMKELLDSRSSPPKKEEAAPSDKPSGFQWDKSGAVEDGIRPVGTQTGGPINLRDMTSQFPIGQVGQARTADQMDTVPPHTYDQMRNGASEVSRLRKLQPKRM